MRRTRILVLSSIVSLVRTANAVNFDQCLKDINSINIDGKTDNHGHPLPSSTTDATAITYALCVSHCGAGQEPFQWTSFSQQFSTWLLPWLALVSQLPFGANDKLPNLESMLLTVGSPTLAAYSLALTVLNGRWIAQLFASHRGGYPNVQSAVRILGSLQQSLLQVNKEEALLASLVVLPQNDEWWSELAVLLDYTHTWSISAVTSIAWVVIAYIFSLVGYFSQSVLDSLDANGQGIGSVGSLWLWLLPVVIGWLQISPKCDSFRLDQAIKKANSLAYVALSTSTPTPPCKASEISDKRAISFNTSKVNEARLDEHSTPPIFNYARFLPWVRTVMIVSDAFRNASERNYHHDPVVPDAGWRDRSTVNAENATAFEVMEYCAPRPDSTKPTSHRWGLDSSVVTRMLMASALALFLQWGTAGSAILIVWFTPTVGLGCRSASYIVYGLLSTMVWMMLVFSSILTYYSTFTYEGHDVVPIQSRIAHWLSIVLRRSGKLIAAFNAVWIVSSGMLQFSNFYDRCYCNSSVFGLQGGAYDVITPNSDDIVRMRGAWIGGFTLAAVVVGIFVGSVNLFVEKRVAME